MSFLVGLVALGTVYDLYQRWIEKQKCAIVVEKEDAQSQISDIKGKLIERNESNSEFILIFVFVF